MCEAAYRYVTGAHSNAALVNVLVLENPSFLAGLMVMIVLWARMGSRLSLWQQFVQGEGNELVQGHRPRVSACGHLGMRNNTLQRHR